MRRQPRAEGDGKLGHFEPVQLETNILRHELNSSWGIRTLLLKAGLAASTTRHLAGRDSCSATMIRNHETPQHTTIFAPRALMKSGMIFEQCPGSAPTRGADASCLQGRVLASRFSVEWGKFESSQGRPRLSPHQRKLPRRGGWFSAPSCETPIPARLRFWSFFGENCASRFFCSLSG
jgi:hypothetical protein